MDLNVTRRQPSLLDRQTLRVSATLLGIGFVVSFLAGLGHPGREPPNNHIRSFAEYASSSTWTAVHLAQFIGLVIIIAGLLVLYLALDLHSGVPALLARLAAVAAMVAAALYGALQAADGVALKQAVDAWASPRRLRSPLASRAPKPSGGWNGGREAITASSSASA